MKNQAYVIVVHRQDWKDYVSYYAMESNGKAMIRITQTNDKFEFSDLYVEEKYRGQGLGEYMLDYAIRFSKRHIEHGTISISTGDRSAEFCDEWYQKTGFEFDHVEALVNLEEENQEPKWNKSYKIKF